MPLGSMPFKVLHHITTGDLPITDIAVQAHTATLGITNTMLLLSSLLIARMLVGFADYG